MAIIGIQINRENPSFTKCDFMFWMPQFTKYMNTQEGDTVFNKLYNIANNKIISEIYGADWEIAMSLCIAHYLQLLANQIQAPSGNTLESIAGGGTYKGLLASMSVGSFSKSYNLSSTLVESDEAKFWNQTSYGAQLMALYKTKAIPSIFVVTSNPIGRNKR